MGRLAKPGDPLCTPRGEVKLPETEPEKINDLTLAAPVIRRMNISSKRNPNEMPSNDHTTQTAINAVLVYHLLGLTVNEIAHIVGTDLMTIENLQMGSDYQMTFEMVFNEIINANSNSLQATLGRHAHSAINQLVELHKSSKNDMVRLKASQDIADRAGLSADTLYGKSSTSEEDTLKIVISDGEDHPKTNISIKVKR